MNAKGCCGTDMVIGDIDFPITERNYGFNFENLRPRGIGTIGTAHDFDIAHLIY